jgi:hypothetical protein
MPPPTKANDRNIVTVIGLGAEPVGEVGQMSLTQILTEAGV